MELDARRDAPVVSVVAVTRHFGRRVALSNVSLAWGLGVHGLLGPNGAGKTTLLRIMATIDRPSTGQLLLFGQPADSSEANIRGRIGYLPQNVGAPHGLTPRDLVTYVARLRGMVAQVESRVEEALEMAGALPFANRRIRRLSGGQRQRAGIAAAIVGTPPLVLLDEPTSGLDPEQRVAFRSLIRHLATRATVVLSTHLVEDVAHGCETVTILNRGHVLFDGPTERLLEVWHGISSNEASALEQAYMSLMRSDDSGLIA